MEVGLCQNWLDRVADCVFADDLDTWLDHFSLPLAILSEFQASRIETVQGLTDKFETWKRMFAASGVTQLVRTVRRVIQAGDDRIVALYDTDMLSDGKRTRPRFDSVLVLELQGNQWRCTELVTGLGAADSYLVHDRQTRGMYAAE
ncbi:hypothetical protein EU805_10585 [Salipiger sp. IMCC34102]|uniref:hypothetical protein n=1 Tax=Salipiger sp. IMCC34102 TaxID=2510647 RepID=UPI00101C85A3|nr:hypothetical protein [Salipiger sp. IMCC34102]RYH02288.1 hypothetical protein EU805_10585 [Salipiger sp. IMCC34102]